jgi:hypothetical protein
VVTLPLSEALAAIRSGEIVDGKTVATLLWGATLAREVMDEGRSAPPRSVSVESAEGPTS